VEHDAGCRLGPASATALLHNFAAPDDGNRRSISHSARTTATTAPFRRPLQPQKPGTLA